MLDTTPSLLDESPRVASRPCDACGAPLGPHEAFCGACGTEQAVDAEIVEPAPPPEYIECENCGAQVAIDPGERSYVCPFCDSTYVARQEALSSDRQAPEFVVPFAVTRDEARERFRGWIAGGGWLRPGDLDRASLDGKIQGVYLPFWSFSMLLESRWSARIGEYWYRTEHYTVRRGGKTERRTRRVRHTEWWNLEGGYHQHHSGYLIAGSGSLSPDEAARIKPFHLAAAQRYAPRLLAGWMCEEYSVPPQEARHVCRAEFDRRQKSEIAAHLPGDTHQSLRIDTASRHVHRDLVLLPVYLLNYRHRGRQYRFLINGQTGKVSGTRPVSGWKIAAVLLAVALVGAAVVLLATQL